MEDEEDDARRVPGRRWTYRWLCSVGIEQNDTVTLVLK
jgi:hypothetical protein